MPQFITQNPLSEDEIFEREVLISVQKDRLQQARVELSESMYQLRMDKLGIVPMKTVVSIKFSESMKYVVSPHKPEYAFRDMGYLRGFKILKNGILGKVPVLICSAVEICGYYDNEYRQIWLSYPLNKPDDLGATYIVVDENGVEYQTSGTVFTDVSNVKFFRKMVGEKKK